MQTQKNDKKKREKATTFEIEVRSDRRCSGTQGDLNY